jgi:CheY-like chemotaxis protein
VTKESTAATKKVLLVDDSEMTLFLGAMILSKSPGLQLLTARDGEEAVRIAQQERPDVIVMDVVMPRMNGMQACRLLRASEATRRIPIILVTTHGEDDQTLGGFASGCTAYITKPFNSADLTRAVEKHLRGDN